MYKALLFFFLLSFSFLCASAQKIHFTDTSNKWGMLGTSWGGPIISHGFEEHYLEQKIINGVAYSNFTFGMVREDTLNNRVLYLQDTVEIILYDFNLKIGDTVSHINHIVKANDTSLFIVDSLKTILINNTAHKLWHMHSLKNSFFGLYMDHYVIEGIGATGGPLFPLLPWSFEYTTDLICFETNGGHPIIAPKVAIFDNTTSCLLSVSGLDKKSNKTIITPNPANANSRIIFPYNILQGYVTIVNTIGQVMMQRDIKNETEAGIGDHINTAGFYYYILRDAESNRTFTGKFVYQ